MFSIGGSILGAACGNSDSTLSSDNNAPISSTER
jgi:hypothetical protein